MRIIYMGTPDFSVGALESLIRAGHDICLVVTQPDKPKGRGKNVQFSPVKECALAHGLEIFQPKRIREPENIPFLQKYNADVMVVAAFGQILPKEILDMTVSMYTVLCFQNIGERHRFNGQSLMARNLQVSPSCRWTLE